MCNKESDRVISSNLLTKQHFKDTQILVDEISNLT